MFGIAAACQHSQCTIAASRHKGFRLEPPIGEKHECSRIHTEEAKSQQAAKKSLTALRLSRLTCPPNNLPREVVCLLFGRQLG